MSTGLGVGHEGDSALKKLHAITKAPIFSLFDVFFTGETVGGLMHSMLEEAQETAAVAIRILNGEKAGDTTNQICNSEIRLEGNAAVGDQREKPTAGQ
jgi:hypothetical protein